MTIKERLVRRSQEDIIEIGHILERFYSSDAGDVLRAIINGRIARESRVHEDGRTQLDPARILGRIEAWQMLIDDIETAIQDKDSLTQPLPEEESNG